MEKGGAKKGEGEEREWGGALSKESSVSSGSWHNCNHFRFLIHPRKRLNHLPMRIMHSLEEEESGVRIEARGCTGKQGGEKGKEYSWQIETVFSFLAFHSSPAKTSRTRCVLKEEAKRKRVWSSVHFLRGKGRKGR